MPNHAGFASFCEAIKVHAAKLAQKITLFATKKRRCLFIAPIIDDIIISFCFSRP